MGSALFNLTHTQTARLDEGDASTADKKADSPLAGWSILPRPQD
jgi:hypothetical protein